MAGLMKVEDFKYDAERCIGCGGCRWVDHIYMSGVKYGQRCPSISRYLFMDHQAAGRLKIANALMEGRLDYSPYLLDVIYQCNLCGACDVGCKRNLDLEVLEVLKGLRVKAVEDGHGPMPEHKKLCKTIVQKKNRYGASQKMRLKFLDKPRSKKAGGRNSSPDFCYFAGCASSFHRKDLASRTWEILDRIGASVAVLNENGSEEWCCGHPLIDTGHVNDAMELMMHNLESIKKTGAKSVLTTCSECYKTIKVDYPRLLGISTEKLGFKVMHITELMNDLIGKGEIKFEKELGMRVAYHDPCNLGRLSEPWVTWEGTRKKYGVLDPPKQYRRGTFGIYEPPRNVLKSIPGLELVEMARHRENAWCCGGGGGVREAYGDFASWTARKRMEEILDTGAEAVVTACPYCEEQFARAAKETGRRIEVLDIVDVMHRSIS